MLRQRPILISSLLIVFVLFICGEARATPLTSGLLGYWQFNGNGADSSGNGRDVSLFGGAGYGPGLFGQALSLNGTQGMFAQRPTNDTAFDFGSGDFTIQTWANFNTVSRIQTLIEKFTGSSGPGWTLSILAPLQFFASPTVVLNAGVTIPTGTWQEFVARRTGSTFDLFFDNNLVATGTSSSALPTSTNPLLIGARNSGDGRNFTVDGLIDEVAIWDRGLSDADITSIWNGGAGLQLTSVPEPSSSILVASGIVALVLLRWRYIPFKLRQRKAT